MLWEKHFFLTFLKPPSTNARIGLSCLWRCLPMKSREQGDSHLVQSVSALHHRCPSATTPLARDWVLAWESLLGIFILNHASIICRSHILCFRRCPTPWISKTQIYLFCISSYLIHTDKCKSLWIKIKWRDYMHVKFIRSLCTAE